MLRRVALCALAASALLLLITATAGAARVRFPSRCTNEAMQPSLIIVACGDGNFYVNRLAWSSWGGRVAKARGTAHTNDCKPYCAAGRFHAYPAAVRLSHRVRCHTRRNHGRLQYTRITVRFLERSPVAGRREHAPMPCPGATVKHPAG